MLYWPPKICKKATILNVNIHILVRVQALTTTLTVIRQIGVRHGTVKAFVNVMEYSQNILLKKSEIWFHIYFLS